MLNGAIKLGVKLDIKQMNQKDSRQYPSKLLDIKEDVISITMPLEKSQVIILDVGVKYSVTFYTNKGLFAADAVVTRRYKVNSLYVAELQLLKAPKKIQRREYYRFNCVIELSFCEIPNTEFQEVLRRIRNSNTVHGMSEVQMKIRAIDLLKNDTKNNKLSLVEMQKGIVTDISGGGLKFNTKKEINSEKELYLEFSIDDGLKIVNAFGVIKASERSLDRTDFYQYRLMFSDISDEQREEIVRYIFNQERIIRQKEKGFN